MRTAALLFCSNQVSVKNIKSRVCSVIKSLIKNVFPAKELTFNEANLSVLEVLFAPSCLGAVCGTQGMITLFKDLFECNSLCFDWATFQSQSQSSFIVNFFACQSGTCGWYKGIDKNVSHSPTVKHIKCTGITTDKTRHFLHIDVKRHTDTRTAAYVFFKVRLW